MGTSINKCHVNFENPPELGKFENPNPKHTVF